MIKVAALWRHPIKSHGREALESITLVAGQTMPWDRHWAVTHDQSKFDTTDPAWIGCRNFMIGTSNPRLAGLWAQLDEATKTLTLRHQDIGELRFRPDVAEDVAKFINWVRPLCPADKGQPASLVNVPDRGMTDTDYPTVSIMTTASHSAVAGRLGRALEPERWRGNIWLDGTAPWEEFEWIGKELRLGEAIMQIHEPIRRCKHTMANPKTGLRDTDTLAVLRDGWDHQNFGVYATVIQGGKVAVKAKVEVI